MMSWKSWKCFLDLKSQGGKGDKHHMVNREQIYDTFRTQANAQGFMHISGEYDSNKISSPLLYKKTSKRNRVPISRV